MRINYVSHGIGITSGGARTIVELANKLAERGHEVSITTLRYKGEMELLEKAGIKPRFKLIFAPFAGSFPYRAAKRVFRDTPLSFYPYVENRLLMKVMPECDINIGLQSYTAFAVYESGKGKPFHHYMHYEPVLFEKESDADKRRLVEETYFLPSVKIINSTWLQRMMREKLGIIVPNENIVSHGFCSEYFHPRSEVKKDPQRKRIISLGRSFPLKGLADLLVAFRTVYEKNKAVQLVLFTPEKNLSVPADLPIEVHHSPVNDELGKLYNSADVMVCPSWFESFPWPPLEAMASGVPVVTTRYGVEDYAIHEENALVVEPRQPKEMAEAIMRLLEDNFLYDKLIANGLETAKLFTWDNLTDQVERIFRNNL